MLLLLNVLRDYLIGHIPSAAAEVSARPQMPFTILPAQMLKFVS